MKKINFRSIFQQLFKSILISLIIALFFTACDKKAKDSEDLLLQPQELLIGKWECTLDAYGNLWDEPLIMFFDSEGTGYYWFSEESFSKRYEFRYVATTSKLRIKEKDESYDLRFEISSNGNTLILYGFDDDDMEELWFTRLN